MKFYKINTNVCQKLTGIECDKCHQLYKSNNEINVKEIYSFNLENKITDLATGHVECDICENCLCDMLIKFGRVSYEYF